MSTCWPRLPAACLVEDIVQAVDLVPGQEPRAFRTRVRPDTPGRVDRDVFKLHRVVEDVTQHCQCA